MTVDQALSIYRGLNANEQQRFLAALAYELTILAREAYSVGEQGINHPRLIRVINEMQHRLLATVAKHLEGDQERFPDEVLLQGLSHAAQVGGFEQQFAVALNTAAEQIRKESR